MNVAPWNLFRALIPNRAGLAVDVRLNDGTEVRTIVVCGVLGEGLHSLRDVETERVVAWRRSATCGA